MSVIVHLRIPADSFELGRILKLDAQTSVELMTMVPLGESAVPLFTVENDGDPQFEEAVKNHPSVNDVEVMSKHDDETVFALDWDVARDIFFQGVHVTDAHILGGKGTANTWEFELRFPNHSSLSEFQEYCLDGHIELEVGRIYNPTRPGSGPWYGLSHEQRETLSRAVQGGYYSIPRRMSTEELAEEFGVSDQAVTERLRRAIITLVENTLIATMEEEEEYTLVQ